MYKYSITALLSILFFSLSFSQTPPACTETLLSGASTKIVTAGQVICVPGGSNWSGSFLVRNGGQIVICPETFNGSVTIESGGTLWDSPSVVYMGAVAILGTRNTNASNCSTCSAPSSGTLTTPTTICSGQQTGITGSAVTNATYTWQKENTLNANDWVAIGGNTQNLAAGTIGNLTTTTRFRRRTSDCSPVQTSSWVTVIVTVNALPSNSLVAENGSRCGTGTVYLNVTGVEAGKTVDWYSNASGGAVLSNGENRTSFTTPSINTTTTYFAEVRDITNGCVSSSRIPVGATVSQNITNTTITGNNNLCSGESTILTANVTIDNNSPNNYAWYRNSLIPDNLITQNTSNTLSVNQSGNYYVIVTNGANNSCKDTINEPFVVVTNFNNDKTNIQSTNNFLKGSTANFTVVNPSNNLNYIWQSDLGQGFQSLKNYGNYNGVNTSNLSISNIQLSEYNQPIRVIASSGNCTDTSNVIIINILDTCVNLVNTYDTILTTVTDTLVIKTLITNVNIPTQINTLKVFPNPASSHIYIDYGNFDLMNGYILTIFNSFGQVVFTSTINQQTSYIDLSTWSSSGVYYIRLIDSHNTIVETRKILIN